MEFKEQEQEQEQKQEQKNRQEQDQEQEQENGLEQGLNLCCKLAELQWLCHILHYSPLDLGTR